MNYIYKAQKKADLTTAKTMGKMITLLCVDFDAYDGFFQQYATTKCDVTVHNKNDEIESYKVMVITKCDGRDAGYNRGEKNKWFGCNNEDVAFQNAINKRMREMFVTNKNDYVFPMQYSAKKSTLTGGNYGQSGASYEELVTSRWILCRRVGDNRIEIWATSPKAKWGSWPMYRLWPDPDIEYLS